MSEVERAIAFIDSLDPGAGPESEDPIGGHVARMVRQRDAIKERFIELYLAGTGARIEDTVLVQQVAGAKILFWCEPRAPERR